MTPCNAGCGKTPSPLWPMRPRFHAVAALQYFGPLENTFSSFTGGRPETGAHRGKMITTKPKIILALFVYNERQEMKKRLIAGLLSAAVLAGISAIPAEAACKGATHCYGTTTATSFTSKPSSATRQVVLRKTPARTASVHARRSPTKLAASHSHRRVQVASNSKRIRAVSRSQTAGRGTCRAGWRQRLAGQRHLADQGDGAVARCSHLVRAAHRPCRVQLQSQHARQPRRIWRVPDEVRHRQGHRLPRQLRGPSRCAHQHPVGPAATWRWPSASPTATCAWRPRSTMAAWAAAPSWQATSPRCSDDLKERGLIVSAPSPLPRLPA